MRFREFITQLDKRALRAGGVTALMFALAAALLIFGNRYIALPDTALQDMLGSVSGSHWALPACIAAFTLAAFIGVPQWALIAGAVVAFGPLTGFVYSWISVMISATVDFMIGRTIGADRVQRFGGALVNRVTGLVQKNGFATSFMVRLVPTGPFVLVNMAAGVSRMTLPAFLGGTALGIIPKIAAVAFLGQSLYSAMQGRPAVFGLSFTAFLAVSVGGMLFARRRLKIKDNTPR